IGLENASGDYLMFLDDDDLLYSDHIEVLVNALEENKDYVAAYSLAWLIETKIENKKIIKERYLKIKEHAIEFDFNILKGSNSVFKDINLLSPVIGIE
ncbi:MAG: glycosyltransferase, partial [Campylobacteraceae bacterium]|nr:glycosyltransferase [Campylobacteraceae bacterium]